MTQPSWRLRLLTFGMRNFTKPKLRRTLTPEQANRDFERGAPFLFSTPKGLKQDEHFGLPRFWIGQPGPTAILYLHGGAFVTGSARSYRAMAGRLAQRTGAQVYLPEYPLLQDAPFPAAPDAVRAAWDAIRAEIPSHRIALVGDSAGGNLMFGLLADLLADGIRPAAAVAFSPWGDLTMSGESLRKNTATEALLPVERMAEVVELYLQGADPTDPRASPVFADFPNPPPVLVQVGAGEVLLSDAERLAQRCDAELSVWPHTPHVWQMFDGRLREANEAMRAVAAFLQTSFDKASR